MAEPTPTPMSDERLMKYRALLHAGNRLKAETVIPLLHEVDRLKAVLATARAEERAECAKVAEHYRPFPSGRFRLVVETTKANIAAAIRSRS